MNTNQEQFDALKKPFSFDEIELKPQSISRNKDKALCVPYIRASAARARLNVIFGPWNWNAEYREILAGKGGVICRLTVTTADGKVVTREGMAGFSDIEAIKGGESDSFKRAFAALGNDSLQKAELGWHPIKTYGEGDRAKFDSWADEAGIRRKYESLMGLAKNKVGGSAQGGENPADAKPKAMTTDDKIKSFQLTKDQALTLKSAFPDAGAFKGWVASQYDAGARTFDHLHKALPQLATA